MRFKQIGFKEMALDEMAETDMKRVVAALETITDPDRVTVQYMGHENSVSDLIIVDILVSSMTFSFEEGTFVIGSLNHGVSSKYSKSLEDMMDILESHIEIFNNYMDLLQRSL